MHVLRSGHSGVRAGASSLVHDVSWFVRPIKEQRSVRLLGVGKSVIASIMSLLMEYPSEVSMKLAKWAWGGKISICHSSEKFLSLHSGTGSL